MGFSVGQQIGVSRVLTTCGSAASGALDGRHFAEKRLRQSVRFVGTNPEAMPIIELDLHSIQSRHVPQPACRSQPNPPAVIPRGFYHPDLADATPSTNPTSTAVVTRTGSDTRKLHQTTAAEATPIPPTVARLTCVCR
jgi:hypothetical protein